MKFWKKCKPIWACLPAVLTALCIAISLVDYTAPVLTVEITPDAEETLSENEAMDSDAEAETEDQTETQTETQTKEVVLTSEAVQKLANVVENGTYVDGVYTGTGTGFRGEIVVQVTISGGKIISIVILSAQDDEPYLTNASALLQTIIAQQTTNVDVVSGATYSSNGLIEAVRDALSKAGGSTSDESSTDSSPSANASSQNGTSSHSVAITSVSEAAAYQDGIYIGTGTGFGGELTVQVVISGGKITEITILDANDDEPYLTNASVLLQTIIAQQTTNVDAISGATYSSNGLIEAVRDALSKAATSDDAKTTTGVTTGKKTTTTTVTKATNVSEAAAYQDGTYTGTGTGFGGELTVQVVISGGKITKITILDANDDEPYLTNASALLQTIIAQQTTNVDAISGATYSSNGLIEAVRDALSKAATSDNTKTTTGVTTGKKTTTTAVTKVTKATIAVSEEEEEAGTFSYEDGVYTGTGEGFRGDITVQITLKNGYLTAIEVLESEDDEPYFSNASALIQTVLNEQNADVDVVSGATYSSYGILDAIADALQSAAQASEKTTTTTAAVTTVSAVKTTTGSGSQDETQTTAVVTTNTATVYADGTYEGTAVCDPDESEDFESYNLSVQVVIENDVILSISDIVGTGTNYDSENDWYIDRAANGTSRYTGVVDQILENASVSDIDAVSGATCSSEAIVKAVANALKQAKQ